MEVQDLRRAVELASWSVKMDMLWRTLWSGWFFSLLVAVVAFVAWFMATNEETRVFEEVAVICCVVAFVTMCIIAMGVILGRVTEIHWRIHALWGNVVERSVERLKVGTLDEKTALKVLEFGLKFNKYLNDTRSLNIWRHPASRSRQQDLLDQVDDLRVELGGESARH